VPVVLLLCWEAGAEHAKLMTICVMLMQAILAAVFCLMDLLAFYCAFELVLLPTFMVVGV